MDAARSAPARHRRAFAAAAAVVIGLDQLTKQLAVSGLDDGPIELPGPVTLKLTFNDGAAFSLGSGRSTWIALLAAAVAAVLAWVGWRADRAPMALGFGIIFGGAAGNLIDRALRAGDGFLGGHVVDFVDVGRWPVFNAADAALWVGIGVLLLAGRGEREEPSRDGGAEDGP